MQLKENMLIQGDNLDALKSLMPYVAGRVKCVFIDPPYNGILGDKRTADGNVLNSAVYAELPPFDGPKMIYGEWCPWGAERLKRERVDFKQTPYDVRVR